jgi:hypothetical protein
MESCYTGFFHTLKKEFLCMLRADFHGGKCWQCLLCKQCRVGWFWTFFKFSTKVPLRFVTYLPKVPKIAKKNLDPVTASSLVMTFWVMHYIYKGSKFFFSQFGLQKKKLSRKKNVFSTQGAPCVQMKIFILEYLFLGAFCHWGKFIFLKST